MKLEQIVSWLDTTLNVAAFDDVSNNGLQVSRTASEGAGGAGALCDAGREGTPGTGLCDAASGGAGGTVRTVAFAVDASVRAVQAAAAAGAELLVVHHGISWGGGIKRLEGGVYNVVKAAMDANIAIYACHLPLDAHPKLGNNAQLAKLFKLKNVKPAFNYHGNVIGCVGNCLMVGLLDYWKRRGWPVGLLRNQTIKQSNNPTIRLGLCSGGAGEFAEEAKNLGCDLYVTGEASWGDVIAAENCGMTMVCLGHYETEVWGVRAVSVEMKKALKLKTVDLTEELRRPE